MGKRRKRFLLGVVAGSALGMLFAPKDGKTLRKEMEESGFEPLKDSYVEMGKDLAKTTKDLYESDEVQEKVEQGKQVAGDWIAEGTKRAKSYMSDMVRKMKKMSKK